MKAAIAHDHLVERMSDLIARYSSEQHDLARRLYVLRRARTDLRFGRSPDAVLALVEEELGPLHRPIGTEPPGSVMLAV